MVHISGRRERACFWNWLRVFLVYRQKGSSKVFADKFTLSSGTWLAKTQRAKKHPSDDTKT
ncbi:hypothetical protein BpHYR1_005302 [Brachionus plicatilis]|uniref:Uncharacterized protein n=1 Tax=Brachionus plicatilis TaxID=10195 RepID=A0A3M7S6B6_BRAPC|nr:hypothetical protein BpHYR1_005302 [Brachionus plicatilis]